MTSLEQSNSQRREVGWWLPGTGGRGESVFKMGTVLPFGVTHWRWWWWPEHSNGNVLNVTDPHT